MDARTKIDIIYNDLIGDIKEILDRIDALKAEVPASISGSVQGNIDKTGDYFRQLADVLNSIRPEIKKVVTAETGNMAAQVGTLVKAAESLNNKADEVIKARTASLETIIKTQVESSIQQALSSKIHNELHGLKHELSAISERAQKIAAEADKASHGNFYWRIGSLAFAGLIGGLAASCMLIAGLKYGSVKVDIDPRQTAIELSNQFQTRK